MTSSAVKTLPFSQKLGFPQRQRCKINGTAYDFFFRWNETGSFVTTRIVRVQDNYQVWSSKLTQWWVRVIKDEDAEEIFLLWVEAANPDRVEVWV
ncbi:hypothetical protein, partial [Methanoregula sp.]|uniref:hypothetical protein n=1 Tax=Methanoregula sp. TaxID=2052170 RepID=UPI000CA8CF21